MFFLRSIEAIFIQNTIICIMRKCKRFTVETVCRVLNYSVDTGKYRLIDSHSDVYRNGYLLLS